MGGDKESVTGRVADIKTVASRIELFVVLERGLRGRHACQRRRMGGRRRGEGEGSGNGREGRKPILRKKESHSCGPSATVNAMVDIELDCTDFDSIALITVTVSPLRWLFFFLGMMWVCLGSVYTCTKQFTYMYFMA